MNFGQRFETHLVVGRRCYNDDEAIESIVSEILKKSDQSLIWSQLNERCLNEKPDYIVTT